MPSEHSFFSLSEMKQPVNQWICIAFICVWVFWMGLFYLTHKAQVIGDTFSNQMGNVLE
jgi:hypothetical protein